jgi:uncharacterized protein YdeI (YjbR/CyaY-like superfamily)
MKKSSQLSGKAKKTIKKELQVKSFSSVRGFESWLSKNHNTADGIWVRIYKKNSGTSSITHEEALEVSLCYGWIDSQGKSYDEFSHLQKFTPRTSRSIWSKRNKMLFAKLKKQGRMTPAGLKEANAAKADGRWARAYDSFSKMKIPEDFLKELSKNKEAEAFFKTLNKTNLYSIGWRLQTAKKSETREKRKKIIIEMLANGKKFH